MTLQHGRPGSSTTSGRAFFEMRGVIAAVHVPMYGHDSLFFTTAQTEGAVAVRGKSPVASTIRRVYSPVVFAILRVPSRFFPDMVYSRETSAFRYHNRREGVIFDIGF